MPNQVEITRQNVGAHNVTSPVGSEIMAKYTGMRDHQKVHMSGGGNSQITDALEELGMATAHRSNKLDLGMRKIKKGRSTNPEALSRVIQFMQDKLPDLPSKEKLRQLVGRLQAFQDRLNQTGRGSGNQPTKQDIMEALQQYSSDVTIQHAARAAVLQFFRPLRTNRRGVTGPDIVDLLEEAADEFEKTDVMRDVQAGYAAARKAHEIAPKIGSDPQSLRDSYRELLRSDKDYGTLFDMFRKYGMEKNFDDVLDMFIATAGHDMTSASPSVDPVFLGNVLTELGKLKKMKTVHESVGTVVEQTTRAIEHLTEELDRTEVTSRLFHFCAKPNVGLSDARKLVEFSGMKKAVDQLHLGTGLLNVYGEVPDVVMPTLAARQKQTSILRSLIDKLVEKEETEYKLETGTN